MLTLRETAEGLIEIVEMRPTVLGTFRQRDVAEDFLVWYRSRPAPSAPPQAEPTAAAKIPAPSRNAYVPTPIQHDHGIMAQLPAVVAQPRPAPRPKLIPLNDREREEVIDRVTAGETCQRVAGALGVPFGQVRGVWAAHKQRLQKHIAEGGPAECDVCAKPFMPSASQPSTCARCSRD